MYYAACLMVIAFVVAVVLTKVEIPVLRKKAGQNIREDGPESHLSKAGTPSMGGIAIIIAAASASLFGGVIFEANMLEVVLINLVFEETVTSS